MKTAIDYNRIPNHNCSWLNLLHESVKGPFEIWHELFIRTRKFG